MARTILLFTSFFLIAMGAYAQAPGETREDEAVGASINYVFATDLGTGVYDLGGRSLQIYRYTWRKELRETTHDQVGLRFVVPVTAGFFDFHPIDVISSGPPTRVDSFSVVPGIQADYLLPGDWHLVPYVRTGFSVASSSVDGWLYGAGVRVERHADYRGWDGFKRSDLAYAGVKYRHDAPGDRFLRFRQGFDFTRGAGWSARGKELEVGLYAIFDLIADPPTAPVAGGEDAPVQFELGITFASRPRVKIWKFDAPRLGVGYRVAGELSAWRVVIGAPF
ncbi:MAG: hypothetical protein K0Q92_3267 [Steroidobacteraceae bacterium]|jgi:hypothetical protein|nr:hypothetical protein [Steroidobacteraceae bacterium]